MIHEFLEIVRGIDVGQVGAAEDALGLQFHGDARAHFAGLVVDQKLNAGDVADLNAENIDRRTRGEAVDRGGEVGDDRDLSFIGGGFGFLTRGVELEGGVIWAGRAVCGVLRHAEGDTAGNGRLDRLQFDMQHAALDFGGDARGIPEMAVRTDEIIERGAHENADFDRAEAIADIVAQHLADHDVAVEDRRAGDQRAEIVGGQHIGAARLVRAHAGRLFEPGETGLGSAPPGGPGSTAI